MCVVYLPVPAEVWYLHCRLGSCYFYTHTHTHTQFTYICVYMCIYLYVCIYIYMICHTNGKTKCLLCVCIYIYKIYHTNYKGRSYITKWVMTEFLASVGVFLLAFRLGSVFELG